MEKARRVDLVWFFIFEISPCVGFLIYAGPIINYLFGRNRGLWCLSGFWSVYLKGMKGDCGERRRAF